MRRALRVLHIVSGDLWAGAEVQAFTLMSHLKRFPETEVAAVLMNSGTLADKLRSVGVPVHVLDERRATSLAVFCQLRGVLQQWRPDVVHTHRVKENILGSIANRSCWNVPSVRTVHGAMEHPRRRGLRGIRRGVVTSVDRWCGRALQQRIIAVTQDLKLLMEAEFPAEKIVVIENGVDIEQLRRDVEVADFRMAEPDVTHVGIAGRLVDVKRVDLFIDGAALLLREHSERRWRFHIFGEGPLREDLKRRAECLQLGDSVIFHGHRENMATCFGGLDALVICSDHEGMPMVALEAAALHVPTVAHAVGGLLEVLPKEFLVFRHDAFGYAEGILRALRADGREIAASRASETLIRLSAQRNAERVRALYWHMLAEINGECKES